MLPPTVHDCDGDMNGMLPPRLCKHYAALMTKPLCAVRPMRCSCREEWSIAYLVLPSIQYSHCDLLDPPGYRIQYTGSPLTREDSNARSLYSLSRPQADLFPIIN